MCVILHSLGTTYVVIFLYTQSKTVNTISILLVFDGLWHHAQNEEDTPYTTADDWCRRELNLKAREGRGSDSVAGAPSCLSISDMTTLLRQSYWFETKKQTSIYWSRCDELKCDTLVGGGGESVVYWREVGAGGLGGDAPSATTRAIIPNTLIFRALFSRTGFWHFFASLFAPVLRLHPFGARVLSSVIGFPHAALTLLRILVSNESLQSVICNVVVCSSTIDPVSICNVWTMNHTSWVLTMGVASVGGGCRDTPPPTFLWIFCKTMI